MDDWLFYPYDMSCYLLEDTGARVTSGDSTGDRFGESYPPQTESLRRAVLEMTPFALLPLATFVIMLIAAFR
jgi:hypothetical protein